MRIRLSAAFAAVLAGILWGSAGAYEGDNYEFGLGLMKLGYHDLAEEAFIRLREAGELPKSRRVEGKLGLGMLKKRLAAASAEAGEKARLCEEACGHFAGFLEECGRSHPRRQTAMAERAEIRLDLAVAVAKEANVQKDAARAAELRRKAGELFDAALKPLLDAEADAREDYRTKERDLEPVTEDRVTRRDKIELMRLLEAAVMAHRRYINAAFKKAVLYERGTKEMKAFVASMNAFIDARIDDFLMYDLVISWLQLAKGRAYYELGDYDAACEKGFDPVISLDSRYLPRPVRSFVDEMRLRAYYLKAKCALETEHLQECVSTVDLMLSLEYHDAIEREIGKHAALLKADALADLGRYETAIRSLDAILRHSPPEGPWSAEVGERRRRYVEEVKRPLDLGPRDRCSIARGYYRRGEYEKAVFAYREAIAASRDADGAYLDRLRYEPRSWLEMGLAYYKAGQLYESALCFETVLKEFSPRELGRRFAADRRWAKLLASARAAPGAGDGYVGLYEAISDRRPYSEVLAKVSESFEKSVDNYPRALARLSRRTGSSFDAMLYLQALETVRPFRPEMAGEVLYLKALAMFDEGDRMLSESRSLAPSDAAAAAARLGAGAAKLDEAARGFLAVPRDCIRHEDALHRRADALYRIAAAMENSKRRIETVKAGEIAARARAALEAQGAYLAFVEADRDPGPRVERLRAGRLASIRAVRPRLLLIAGDARRSIAEATSHLADGGREKKHDTFVMWTRFKAHRHIVADGAADPGERDGAVAKMVELAAEMKTHPGGERYHRAALGLIVVTMSDLASALKAVRDGAAERGAGAEAIARLEGMIRKHEHGAALLQGEMIGADPSAQEVAHAAGRLFEQGCWAEARQLYERLLKARDPDGDLETRALSRAEFAEWRGKMWYDDAEKLRKARADFDRLTDLVFDSDGARSAEAGERGEELIDYVAAMEVADAMVGPGGYARDVQVAGELRAARAELESRLLLLFSTRRSGECSVRLAAAAPAEETAAAERRRARRSFESVLGYWHDDAGLRLELADCYAALAAGDAAAREKALEAYIEVRGKVREKSDLWLRATKGLCSAYLATGDAQKAAGLASFMVVAMSDYTAKAWPEVDEFLDRCREAGAVIVMKVEASPAPEPPGGRWVHDPIVEEHRRMRRSAEMALEQDLITPDQCRARLRKADLWLSRMRRERRRSHERDALKTKYHEMLDRARYLTEVARKPVEAKTLRRKADAWLDSETKKLESKWKAEDEAR